MRQFALKIPALMILSVLSSAAAGDLIQWAANLEQARAIAVQTNKPLLVHFWTPDCGPCKVVESNVFTMPTVAQAINENFVPLKVNAYTNEDLRAHFGVSQWPTDIVSTVDGKVLHRMVTEQNPNQYVHKLTSIAQQSTTSTGQRPDPFAQSPQAQPKQAQQSKWSNEVPAAYTASNERLARRPGIDPSMRPGFDQSMHSAITTSQQRLADQVSNKSRYASPDHRFGSDRADNPGFVQQSRSAPNSVRAEQHSGVLNNRFVANSPGLERTGDTSGRVIANPYAVGSRTSQMSTVPANSQLVTNPAASVRPSRSLGAGTAPRSHLGNSSPPLSQGHVVQPQRQANPIQDKATLGLDGRCPVTLISGGKWRKGDQRWGAIHRGKTYLFAGPEEQQIFLASPDDFSPVLAGMDVVQLADHGRIIEGTRRFGVLYDDDGTGLRKSRIYLFGSADSRNRFESAPERFLQPVMQAMQQGSLDALLRR